MRPPGPCLAAFSSHTMTTCSFVAELHVAGTLLVSYTGTGPAHTGTSGLISPDEFACLMLGNQIGTVSKREL